MSCVTNMHSNYKKTHGIMLISSNPLCKSNNKISGIGLKKVIESLPASIVSRASRNILVCICEVAASSSEYKIFKSKKRMALECGVTVATVRRNLDLAVNAGILTRSFVFDDVKGQCPTEYQFTREFIEIARLACDFIVSKAKDAAAKLSALYSQFALQLSASHRPGMRIGQLLRQRSKAHREKGLHEIPPDQISPPPPDHFDREIEKGVEVEKVKTYSPARAGKGVYGAVKKLKDAVAERAKTRSADLAERKNQAYQERGQEIQRIECEVRRRAYIMNKASERATSTTFPAGRFSAANKAHEADREQTVADLHRAQESGFNPLSFIANLRQNLSLRRREPTCSPNPELSSCSDSQEE